jgi:hypothetical protein
LETVDVKQDTTDSGPKEDTEQKVRYVLKLCNSLPTSSVGFTLFYDSKVPTNGAAFKLNEDAALGSTESSKH